MQLLAVSKCSLRNRKTWTAYRRLAYLISEENIEPSTIWVMSFTKTAVRELSNRLEDLTHFNGSDGFSFSPIAGLKVSTIDSHAGKIRYGFSKEEAKTILEGGFDTNISEATKRSFLMMRLVRDFLAE